MNAILTKTKEKPKLTSLSMHNLVFVTWVFVFAVWATTRTESILPTVVWIVVSSVMFLLHKTYTRIWLMLGICVVAGLSTYLRQHMFTHKQTIRYPATLVATGLVEQRVSKGVFTINSDNKDYRYHTQYEYQVGDILRFTAFAKPTKAPSLTFDRSVTIKNIQKRVANTGFDYNSWLYMKWLYGLLYEENGIVIGQTKATPLEKLRVEGEKRAKEFLSDKNKAWLLLGLIIGDKSLMDKEQYQSFIDSGLVHIIAVSGGNIVMVVAAAMLLLRRLPWYARTCAMMIVIISYAALVWPDSSIIRASIMWLITYMALLQGRPLSVWRSLCYAAIVMLIRNPCFLIADIWFIFSFASVGGLVVMQPFLQIAVKQEAVYKKYLLYCRNLYCVPTIAATCGVLPFLLYFTSSYNVFGVIANMVVLPFVPVTMAVWVAMIMSWRSRLIVRTGYALWYLMFVSDRVSSHGLYVSVENESFALVLLVLIVVLLLGSIIVRYQKNQ